MIDFETWGNTAGAVVVQIGAVYFDPKTGDLGKELKLWVNAEEEMRKGFRANADTLYWWFTQSKDAQDSAMGKPNDRVGCNMAWRSFNQFLAQAESIWCHATFDGAILNTHLKYLGIRPTFKYWAIKDLRTLIEMAGIDTRQYKTGVLHDAVVDCKNQIRYTCDAFKVLGGRPTLANVRTEES
jgi:hypothetical protein